MTDDHGRNRLPGDGYTLHACNLHPRSRGRVTLTGGRATDKPRIEANYLGDPEGFDLKVMVECARISLDIFAQKAFDDYRGAPIFPARLPRNDRSEEHTSELQSLMRISYAVFCLKKKNTQPTSLTKRT